MTDKEKIKKGILNFLAEELAETEVKKAAIKLAEAKTSRTTNSALIQRREAALENAKEDVKTAAKEREKYAKSLDYPSLEKLGDEILKMQSQLKSLVKGGCI